MSKYLLLAAYALVARAQNSIPIATSPVVVTTTVPTVVQSLSTSTSVSTSVSNADQVVTQTTTGSDGSITLIVSTATGAGAQARILVTVTNVQTVDISTNTVVVSTIGSTTIFGPDTAATSDLLTSTSQEARTTSRAPETSTRIETRPAATSFVSSQSSSSKSETTSRSTFAVASAPTTASSPGSSSKGKGLSTGAKVGIAIGSLLIVGFIAFVVIFILKARRQKDDPYLPSEKEMVANSKGASRVGSIKQLGSRKKKAQVDGLGYDPEDSSWLDRPYGELDGKGGQRYEMGARRSKREHYRELDGGTNERHEMGLNSRGGASAGAGAVPALQNGAGGRAVSPRGGPLPPNNTAAGIDAMKRGSGIGWGRAEVEARKSVAGWQPGRTG